jgi:hypothetical protein
MTDSEYMTVKEFAALGSAAHHKVWAAARDGKVASIPASAHGTIRLYRRADVEELLYGETEHATGRGTT